MKRTFITGLLGGITGFVLMAVMISLTGLSSALFINFLNPASTKLVHAEGLEGAANFVEPQGNPAGTPLGTAFTYQGQLKKDNVLYSGECDMTFELWDGDEGYGGDKIYTFSVSPVQVTNGLFSVDVDFGPIAFTGEYRSIKPGFECPAGSGETYYALPQPIRAVPYALSLRPGAEISGVGTETTLSVRNESTEMAIYAHSDYGTAIMANAWGSDAPALSAYSLWGNALQITKGGFEVDGAGVNTETAAFIHEVRSDNDCDGFPYITTIDNSLINGNPDAILLVTYRDAIETPVRHPVGVSYLTFDLCGPGSANHWLIYDLTETPSPLIFGQQFNVWTVLP